MDYFPQPVKSALQRVEGMPFAWSLNPYRGCLHACLYCYARVYHSYIGFDDPADFDRVILYKSDLPNRLRREVQRSRRPIEGEIAIGTATDPYQPLEARERVTRRCLEVLLEAGRCVSITTKSPLVTRDLDLLRQFAAYGGIRVNMTVTVLRDELWRLLEPMTPSPAGRLRAAGRLALAGIPTSVFVAPVVPRIGEEDALDVLKEASHSGVQHAMAQPLRLSPGVREWLLPRLASQYPVETLALESLYGPRQNLPAVDRERILRPILRLRAALGLDEPPVPLHPRSEQLTLFGARQQGAEAGPSLPGAQEPGCKFWTVRSLPHSF